MKLASILTVSTFLFQDTVSAFSTLPLHARRSALSSLHESTQKITRDWTYTSDDGEVYKGDGKITVKVFLPENRKVDEKVEGCAFFMHGFSQYTKAYAETLQKVSNEANVAVLSADTGITSILLDVIKNPFGGPNPQFLLQRKLSEDTKQIIQMIMDGSDDFKKFDIDGNVPMGVCGHSMGGGLSFPVAASKGIDYVFTMAPVPGVPEFDSITKGVDVRTAKHSMLLAGSWDIIGRAGKVEEISAASNKEERKSSIFVEISRGLHTGFEDQLVITTIGVDTILKIVFNLYSLVESLVLKLLSELRTGTGQLEGTGLLMEYFFEKMKKGEDVTVQDAEKFLNDSDMSRDHVEKFSISLGQ